MAQILRDLTNPSPVMVCKQLGEVMSKAWNVVRRLGKDEEGASLIEYTVLLGILLVAVIATIGAVGTWVNGKWTTLQQQLS
jgi:pilus assembly protein Flp/PilA